MYNGQLHPLNRWLTFGHFHLLATVNRAWCEHPCTRFGGVTLEVELGGHMVPPCSFKQNLFLTVFLLWLYSLTISNCDICWPRPFAEIWHVSDLPVVGNCHLCQPAKQQSHIQDTCYCLGCEVGATRLGSACSVTSTWILEQCFILSSCGMVLVTTTASKAALFILEIAGPEKIPWVRIAYTLVAPAESSL